MINEIRSLSVLDIDVLDYLKIRGYIKVPTADIQKRADDVLFSNESIRTSLIIIVSFT